MQKPVRERAGLVKKVGSGEAERWAEMFEGRREEMRECCEQVSVEWVE